MSWPEVRWLFPWAWLGLAGLVALLGLLRESWARGTGLDRAAFVVRALALAALVGTLAGPQVASRQAWRTVFFLVDRSASAAAIADEATVLERLRTFAIPQERTRYGIIVFGREAWVEQPPAERLPPALLTEVDPGGSDLAGALELVLEALPPGPPLPGRAEVVLLSDGQVELEALVGPLERLRRAGVRLWSVPLGPSLPLEVRVDDVQLPEEVTPGAGFEGVVHVHANRATPATLTIYRDDALLSSLELELEPGSQAVRFADALETPGYHRYQVYLQAPDDALLENNVASDLVAVTGEAAVLVLGGSPEAGEALVRLLTAAGYPAEGRAWDPNALRLERLAGYKAVVLANVPLSELDPAGIAALETYTARLGGGLWVIEGRRALEGTATHPLERLLPVSYEGPQQQQLPGVALVFLLDRSSSMGQPAVVGSPRSKLEVLKEAAAASVEILQPDDWLGIVTFDSQHAWLQELGPLGDKRPVYRKIHAIAAGGGTDLLPALREALDRLEEIDSRLKHVLVFSDGKTVRQGRDFAALFARLEAGEVTVSTIGFGRDPDEEMLDRLAKAGHGEYFRVQDARELPQISVRETRRIVRRRWVTGTFAPAAGPQAPARLRGLEVAELPPLAGYVRTYAKPLSQVALVVGDDPLLNFWQYGLGQVAVLNTDLEGLWSGDWLAWPHLSQLAGEVIAQLFAPPVADAGLQLRSERRGDELAFELDAQDGRRWVNLLGVAARLVPAQGDGPETELTFEQVAPGRYRARAGALPAGLYLLRLEARAGEALAAQQVRAVAVPYPSEYRTMGTDLDRLARLARATGGDLVEDEGLDWGPLTRSKARYRDLWPWGLGLSLGLFMLDLALRKLPWPLARA